MYIDFPKESAFLRRDFKLVWTMSCVPHVNANHVGRVRPLQAV